MDRTTYLEHYRVVSDAKGAPVEIRRRGDAVTYKGEDLRSGEEVAVEVMPVAEAMPTVLTQLENEAAGAKELAHINVPKLHAFGRENGNLIYASEYSDGTTAEEWVTTHGPMPVGPALRIGVQVVSTLGAAAFHGIVHGAINPRNILLVPGQTAQGDWPLVKILSLVGLSPTFTGSQFAAAEPDFSAQFASPEQLQNGAVDFRSEMYSLGATLWFLLTGEPPADAADLPRVSGLPKPVLQLIEEMLARNPDERPLDPILFEERIRTCLEGVERREAIGRKFGVPVAAPVPVVKKAEPRAFPWRPLTIAALAFLLATATVFFWWNNLRPGQSVASGTEEIGVPIGVPEESVLVPETAATVANPANSVTQPAPEPMPTESIPIVATAPEETSGEAADQAVAAESSPTTTTTESTGAEPPVMPPSEPVPVVAEASAPSPAPFQEPTVEPAIVKRAPAASTDNLAASTTSAPPAYAQQPATNDPAPVEEKALPAEPEIAQKTTPPTPRTSQPTSAPPTIDGLQVRPAEPIYQGQPAGEPQRVTRTHKRVKRINGLEVRAAEPAEGTPGLPKRSRRARFLGTAEDGSLVFEMPSSEEGYARPRR